MHLQPAQKTCAALNPRCSVARTTAEGQAAHKPDEHWCIPSGLTPRLTGAGARSAQGTNTGHENGGAMASVGVRVEPTVRLGSVGRILEFHFQSVKISASFLGVACWFCNSWLRFPLASCKWRLVAH